MKYLFSTLLIAFAVVFSMCNQSQTTQTPTTPTTTLPQKVVLPTVFPYFVTHCDNEFGVSTTLSFKKPDTIATNWSVFAYNLYYRNVSDSTYQHQSFLYANSTSISLPLPVAANEFKLTTAFRNSTTNTIEETCYQLDGEDFVHFAKCPTERATRPKRAKFIVSIK